MEVHVFDTKQQMGEQAARDGAAFIRTAIAERGHANIIVATGASQFEMLASLVKEPDIDWSRVTGFHLDEYLRLPITHDASFRKYLKERFVDQIPIGSFNYVDGEAGDALGECHRLGEIIARHPIDVAFIGIGENAHIAFNDPPADFDTEAAYLVVELDDACRQQQYGEGWFPTFDDVPTRAISMAVKQIMRSRAIICTVPDERKAEAVAASLRGEVTPDVPASILQQHPDCGLYLDVPAASLLPSD